MIKDVYFTNKLQQQLYGILHIPDVLEDKKLPAVIICHGFNQHSQHDLVWNLSNFLFSSGFVVLRFDFHGHGNSEGTFEHHTFSQQIDDLQSAVEFLAKIKEIDCNRIGVFGQGIGGNVAISTVARDEKIKSEKIGSTIKALVLQGTRANMEEHVMTNLADHEIVELEKKGLFDKGHFRIRRGYWKDAKKHDAVEQIKKVKVPVLFVWGMDDFQTPEHEFRSLFAAANQPKEYEEVSDADHWFRQPEARKVLFELTREWFRKYL